jgi:hypothetical protein
VTYTANQKSELWQTQPESRRLAEWGIGLEDWSQQQKFYFDFDRDWLFIRYTDGRAYLLDLAWLRAMGGQADRMPIRELVRLACEGPLASGLLDEVELKRYMGNYEPRACKK